MQKSFSTQALSLIIGLVVCFASLVCPTNVAADGSGGGDPPPPDPPMDTTITITNEPNDYHNSLEQNEEQSVWEEFLSFFSI